MGLYSNARKLERTREKERDSRAKIIDYSPRNGDTSDATYDESALTSLVEQILPQIDLDSRFIVVGMSLSKLIGGIRNAAPDTKKINIQNEIISFVKKSASNIAHPFQLSDDTMIVVFQSIESIDLELFVHQLYNSLRNCFAGCPGDGCSILKGRARIFPTDGNDMMKLLREVL